MEVYRELIESGADTAGFFKPSDALLDHAPAPVGRTVEPHASVMLGAFVVFVRNHRANAVLTQPPSNSRNAVGFVTRGGARSGARTPYRLRDGERIQERFDAS